MQISLQQTERLLQSNDQFSQLGFSMMLMRMKNTYAIDQSQDVLQACMNEINAFLKKFGTIMAADWSIITKL